MAIIILDSLPSGLETSLIRQGLFLISVYQSQRSPLAGSAWVNSCVQDNQVLQLMMLESSTYPCVKSQILLHQ